MNSYICIETRIKTFWVHTFVLKLETKLFDEQKKNVVCSRYAKVYRGVQKAWRGTLNPPLSVIHGTYIRYDGNMEYVGEKIDLWLLPI